MFDKTLINEKNYCPSQISPTEIANPEMEIIFIKNDLNILRERFNVLCQLLEINHAGVNDDRPS
jgi:hypothetical protein